MAMFDKLHFKPSAYEKAVEKWVNKITNLAIKSMRQDGIYELPIPERAGAWNERWEIATKRYPKPKKEDFNFDNNARSRLVAICAQSGIDK